MFRSIEAVYKANRALHSVGQPFFLSQKLILYHFAEIEGDWDESLVTEGIG